MPLREGTSDKTLGRNIEIEKHAHPNMPTRQAVAIAYAERRKSQHEKNSTGGTEAVEVRSVQHQGINPHDVQPRMFNPVSYAMNKMAIKDCS